MIKAERHAFILAQLGQNQKVITQDLSADLGVSEDTIRRDLKELAAQGIIQKVHGGAVSHSLNPYRYKDREVYGQVEKIQLAQKAQNLLKDGQVIIMDGGTTNLELARRIPKTLRATLFTNSLPVAEALAEHPDLTLIMLGGKLLKDARVSVGMEAIQALQGLRADICFLGTRSLHPELGITEIDWDETLVKRAMVAATEALVCMPITEKLGTTQPYIICPPTRIHTLITTLNPEDFRLQAFQPLGITII